MVEIERPEASTWKVIAVRREREDTVELRFVHGTHPPSSKFDKLTASEARCVACLLLAAAEHPIEGPYAELSLPTTRRIAHALLAESQPLTLTADAP